MAKLVLKKPKPIFLGKLNWETEAILLNADISAYITPAHLSITWEAEAGQPFPYIHQKPTFWEDPGTWPLGKSLHQRRWPQPPWSKSLSPGPLPKMSPNMQPVLEAHLQQGGWSQEYNTCKGWPGSLPDLGAERTIICGCLLQRMLCLDFLTRPRAQGPDFILLSAAWLWPELCAFTRTPLETRPMSLGAVYCLRNGNQANSRSTGSSRKSYCKMTRTKQNSLVIWWG